MNQKSPKIVQYLTGNHCQLVGDYTHKNPFKFDANLVSDAIENCHQFLTFVGIA